MNAFFKAHNLKSYFKDYECSGNTGVPKSENIKLIIERNNLKDTIYVGDTEFDMEATFAAGIPFVFAEYGFGNVHNAKNKISCFSDMLKLDYDNL